ncbi:hypothetical protein [Staphylococcus epidermidis]|nr:hypothetical protein [Staphylococcus epidermidis]
MQQNRKTSQKSKFKSKAGKPYEAFLKLEDDKEKNIKKLSYHLSRVE